MPSDEIAERGGVAGYAFGEFGAAVVEHVLERLQPRREHLAYRVAAPRDRIGELVSSVIEHLFEGLQAGREHFTRRIAATGNDVGGLLRGLSELGAASASALHDRIRDGV